jgi:phage gpG-like protein
MGVTVTITGPSRVSKKFKDMQQRADDLTPVWPKVGRYMSNVANRQFVTEGAFLGKPWKPLKPYYRLWKLRNGFSRKILVKTGAMRKKFTGRPMDVEVYGRHSAEFGVADQKAVWQQYGTHKDGKRVIPPRPILYANRMVKRDVRNIVKDYIVKGDK